MAPRKTHVRDYQKRDGTEVRSHERALGEVDRRDRIVDAIRINALSRRRFEERCINEALAEYADQRHDGATHEQAMDAALRVLDQEAVDADFQMSDSDYDRVKAELEALAVKANERGYQEAASKSRRAPTIHRKASERDNEEERMMSIGDALSDDDEAFSFADVLEDGNEKDERAEGRRKRPAAPVRDDSILGSMAGGLNEVGGYVQRKRNERAAAAVGPNRRDLNRIQANENAARQRHRNAATGPENNYDREAYAAPPGTGVSTARRTGRVVRTHPDEPPAAPPQKGTGRLDE